MQEDIWEQIVWVACMATAIVASLLAIWRSRDPGSRPVRVDFESEADANKVGLCRVFCC
jgi:hypothetical protein